MNDRLPFGRSWWALCFSLSGGAIVIDALQRHAASTELAFTAAGALIFVAMFFSLLRAWKTGRSGLWQTLTIALLGAVFAPFNGAAWIFLVIAAAFAAVVGGEEVRKTIFLIGAIVAIALIATLAANLPWTFVSSVAGFGIPTAVMCTLTLRRAVAVRELARQGERERISRDMHDVLGHTLSLILLKVDLATRVAHEDPDRTVRELADVERITRETLEEVRQTLKGYRTRTLQDEFELAKQTLTIAGLSVSATFDPPQLAPEREQALCLALREGVTNIVRHARATRGALSVAVSSGHCVMIIEDDGEQCPGDATDSGAKPPAARAPRGDGLQGIRERIARLGGAVAADTGRGMRLTITLPISPVSAGEVRTS